MLIGLILLWSVCRTKGLPWPAHPVLEGLCFGFIRAKILHLSLLRSCSVEDVAGSIWKWSQRLLTFI